MKSATKPVSVFMVLFLLLTVSFGTLADGVIEGREPNELYKELCADFVLGEYEAGIALYESNPALEDYSDALSYYRYMKASTDMNAGSFSNAALLFESIKDFKNSKQMDSYCRGRIAEQEGDFAEAIDCYSECTGVSDALTRLSDCNEKYEALLLENRYADACKAYEEAVAQGDYAAVKACRAEFDALGGYKDSRAYIALCDSWIAEADRTLTVSVQVTEDGATVVWADSEPGHTYTLTYSAEGSRSGTELYPVKTSPVLLEDLIPGTSYTLILKDAEHPGVSVKTAFAALPAASGTPEGIRVTRISLAGVPRMYTDTGLATAETIFSSYPTLVEYPDKNEIDSDWLLANEPYAVLSFRQDLSEKKTVQTAHILRFSSGGVFSKAGEPAELSAGKGEFMLLTALDELLTMAEKELGALPKDDYVLEILMDGKLSVSLEFTLN